MYIAVNTIRAPQPAVEAMVGGFRRHAPDLKKFEGFLGFELWHAEDGALMAVSRWTSREAFEKYRNSDAFQSHHAGPGARGSQQGPQAGGPQAGAQAAFYEADVLA